LKMRRTVWCGLQASDIAIDSERVYFSPMSDKEAVIEAIRELPETATLDQISEEVAILASLRRAKQASEAGRVIAHEEVKKQVASWTTK